MDIDVKMNMAVENIIKLDHLVISANVIHPIIITKIKDCI